MVELLVLKVNDFLRRIVIYECVCLLIFGYAFVMRRVLFKLFFCCCYYWDIFLSLVLLIRSHANIASAFDLFFEYTFPTFLLQILITEILRLRRFEKKKMYVFPKRKWQPYTWKIFDLHATVTRFHIITDYINRFSYTFIHIEKNKANSFQRFSMRVALFNINVHKYYSCIVITAKQVALGRNRFKQREIRNIHETPIYNSATMSLSRLWTRFKTSLQFKRIKFQPLKQLGSSNELPTTDLSIPLIME